MSYYEKNADKFIESTKDCDMSKQYELFLKYMPKKGFILDVGFGSGRDMKYFNKKGYFVFGIDITEAFVANIKKQGYQARVQSVEDFNTKNEYNGIWACASLLHVKKENLDKAMTNLKNALKPKGILYASFKYGHEEVIKDERYFNYIDEFDIACLSNTTGLKVLEISMSNDVRKDRADEKWINVVFQK